MRLCKNDHSAAHALYGYSAAHGNFDQLNWKIELSGKEERFSLADAEWGKLPDGHVVGKPTPLFPRIDIGEGV
jgi:hypothetical protein